MFPSLADVAGAIVADQMVPYFQAIVELRSGKVTGFELLARWQRTPEEAILPGNFIALAEENDLMEAFTKQVFRKGFLAANILPAPMTLSVNISPIQLLSFNLPVTIRALSVETGFPTERLVMEITESALMTDLAQVKKVAGELKGLGCKLALDDFGTGFSSLRHLQSLPFDQLKIDHSFVGEMTRKRESRKIVAAIIGLGQSLGLDTVAEGVEAAEQTQMLLWLGCELGQGWRYGRAEPADKLTAVLTAERLASVPQLSTPGDDWASSNLEALPTLRLAQLQAIYDGAPVGLCFLDCKLRYVSLNRRMAELNGLSAASHVGRTVNELFPEWFPIFEPYLMRAFQGEAISGVELTRPPEAGVPERVVLASYQPAWDEADEVIGVSISVLDVTEAKVAERALQAKSEPPASTLQTNPELPWVMDAAGNDLQVSSHWVRTTPLGQDRTRNLRWLEALHVDDLDQAIRIMEQAMRTGTPIDLEYRIQSVDGEWRWMRSRGLPRFGPNGEITRWYGSVEDIHDRKLLG